jgi:hypothetical protein
MRKSLALVVTLFSTGAFAFDVPIADLDKWLALSFSRIPANSVSIADGRLHISVDRSASPLVYKLDEPVRITGVTVTASWTGALRIPEGATQGDDGADDFVLKLGIVEAGDRTLNWLQRRIAADWVRQLFRLAPEGTGVGRINFLSTTQTQSLVDSSRTHPLNDLLHETRIVYLEEQGDFEMTRYFDAPVETLGLWISSDGDDTGSSFDLYIERITLHTE